ncbi:MAG: restriction endonuclease [Chloroflexota bacterium]
MDTKGLAGDVYSVNNKARSELLDQLKKFDPDDFEKLISVLLVELGFEEVETTDYHHDGGIDVRGTLVVADSIRIKMAVQVKRWSQNVQSQTVQQVRGSLSSHEQGLVITTSDFSSGARREAEREDAVPIGLINGKQLISLMFQHEVGVDRVPHEVFKVNLNKFQIDSDDD